MNLIRLLKIVIVANDSKFFQEEISLPDIFSCWLIHVIVRGKGSYVLRNIYRGRKRKSKTPPDAKLGDVGVKSSSSSTETKPKNQQRFPGKLAKDLPLQITPVNPGKLQLTICRMTRACGALT